MGKTAEAEKIMKKALPNATEDEINVYGYKLMEVRMIRQLRFYLNTNRFPKSANTLDSLVKRMQQKEIKRMRLPVLKNH